GPRVLLRCARFHPAADRGHTRPIDPAMTRQRWQTLAVLSLLDLALYFDQAVRWEHGLGFLARPAWQSWSASCVGGWLLCVAWLSWSGSGSFRHGALAFIAGSYGFFIASSGNPAYDWKSLPFYGGLGVS